MTDKHKILIIEDNEDDYIVISRLIKSDYQTIYDNSEGDTISLVSKNQPSCILLDYHLGNESGCVLLTKLKNNPDLANIPVIILTGEKNPEIIVNCMKHGAADYLGKGEFDKSEILAKISKAIGNANLHKKIKEQQIELNRNEQNLRALFNAMQDVIFEIDYDGYYLFIAPTSPEFVSITDENVIGKRIHDLYSKKNADSFLKFVKDCIDSGISKTIEYSLVVDGAKVWFEGTGTPKTKNSILYIARNITKRKLAQSKMIKRSEQLLERNKELDAFSHTVAHDLKNPISTMLSFADYLYQEYDSLSSDETKEHLKTIIDSGNKSLQIIHSLLLFANVNKANIPSQKLNMANIIAESTKRLSTIIIQRKATIEIQEVWPSALGYSPWVEEVWTNYLSNALKYSNEQPIIEMGCDIMPISNNNKQMARFWVRDNGGGISKEDQSSVFLQFERLDQVKIVGHGLGLSIVQRIIKKLGGEVGVESEIGTGSLFYFTLPIV